MRPCLAACMATRVGLMTSVARASAVTVASGRKTGWRWPTRVLLYSAAIACPPHDVQLCPWHRTVRLPSRWTVLFRTHEHVTAAASGHHPLTLVRRVRHQVLSQWARDLHKTGVVVDVEILHPQRVAVAGEQRSDTAEEEPLFLRCDAEFRRTGLRKGQIEVHNLDTCDVHEVTERLVNLDRRHRSTLEHLDLSDSPDTVKRDRDPAR